MRGPKPPPITLSAAERHDLELLVRRHTTPQQLATRARIVLVAADGANNCQIARQLNLSLAMVRRWREQYEQEGENAWPEAADLVVEQDSQQRIRELEAALGRAHLEIELLRRALKQAEKGGSTPRRNGR